MASQLRQFAVFCGADEGFAILIKAALFDPYQQEIGMKDVNPQLEERIQLRKKHPCGSDTWQVVRVGADIGLVCEGCGRKILLARHVFRKRVKKVLSAEEGVGSKK